MEADTLWSSLHLAITECIATRRALDRALFQASHESLSLITTEASALKGFSAAASLLYPELDVIQAKFFMPRPYRQRPDLLRIRRVSADARGVVTGVAAAADLSNLDARERLMGALKLLDEVIGYAGPAITLLGMHYQATILALALSHPDRSGYVAELSRVMDGLDAGLDGQRQMDWSVKWTPRPVYVMPGSPEAAGRALSDVIDWTQVVFRQALQARSVPALHYALVPWRSSVRHLCAIVN